MKKKLSEIVPVISGLLVAVIGTGLIGLHTFYDYSPQLIPFIKFMGDFHIFISLAFFISLFLKRENYARLPIIITFIGVFILFTLLFQWFTSPIKSNIMLVITISVIIVSFITLIILLFIDSPQEKLIPVSVIVGCLFSLYTIYPLNQYADKKAFDEAERMITHLEEYQSEYGRYPVHLMELEEVHFQYRPSLLFAKPIDLEWEFDQYSYRIQYITRFEHETNVYSSGTGEWVEM